MESFHRVWTLLMQLGFVVKVARSEPCDCIAMGAIRTSLLSTRSKTVLVELVGSLGDGVCWSLFAHSSQKAVMEVVMEGYGLEALMTTVELFREIVDNVAGRGDKTCSSHFNVLAGLCQNNNMRI
ncbi:hypothetical protein BC829DRAFT_390419, partial [Chytridium lagenaria]